MNARTELTVGTKITVAVSTDPVTGNTTEYHSIEDFTTGCIDEQSFKVKAESYIYSELPDYNCEECTALPYVNPEQLSEIVGYAIKGIAKKYDTDQTPHKEIDSKEISFSIGKVGVIASNTNNKYMPYVLGTDSTVLFAKLAKAGEAVVLHKDLDSAYEIIDKAMPESIPIILVGREQPTNYAKHFIHADQDFKQQDLKVIKTVFSQKKQEIIKQFEEIDPATGKVREASKAAIKICDNFADLIKKTLKLDSEITLDVIKDTYKFNPFIVDRFINETVRDKNRTEKLYLLTKTENLNTHLKKEAWTHLVATYGQPYDAEILGKDMDAFIEEQTDGMKKGDAEDFAKSVRQIVFTLRNAIYWHVDHNNQRTQLSFSVDMFAQVREVELLEDKAHFTLTHKPIEPMRNTAYADYDSAVIEDYTQHFPEFETVLRFLVMSRFAPDRKKSYLWLHVVSDWGKGFFKAILENLRLCVELSVKEVEGMFEGKPSGQHPDNFRRAFAVVFDEFKTVKSEIKQLERKISLAPKFELRSEVELFAKLFFSAENVHSLVGGAGIEDQMANRFSCIRGINKKLEDRELFKDLGSSEYLRHLTGFAAEYLNKGVKSMQDLGRVKAEKHASEWLIKFHEKYGIDKLGQRLSQVLPDIAEEFRGYLHQQWSFCGGNFSHDYLFTDSKGSLWLRKPQKVFADWLKEQCDPSELAMMMHKRDEILKLVTPNGNVTSKTVKNPHTRSADRGILIR